MKKQLVIFYGLAALCGTAADHSQYPVKRPAREAPTAAEGTYVVHPDQLRQTIRGFGFEIQSDSIASGNSSMPEAFTSVPHDLTPSERERFAREMLAGFRYCRLAGGLYWRGTDPEGRQLQGRWPQQLGELSEMIRSADIEGISLEYWSPAPWWKANRSYVGSDHATNRLRCFGPDFARDPFYQGDTARFLDDFGDALVTDIRTLETRGIRVSKWGLQNEPRDLNGTPDYSRCGYNRDEYVKTFLAVAPKIRAHDPNIEIIADTWKLDCIEPIMNDPQQRKLIDSLVLHHVGCDAARVPGDAAAARRKFGDDKPLYQNEYEYLGGGASPARCMNTVLHIINWFQAGAPAWYWIHALKPIGNTEASGYSLGYWRPANDPNPQDHPDFPGLKPGHWTWNPYNWHAVGSFVKRMPWDCRSVGVSVENDDPDLRVTAFRKPDGKLTIVLANRSFRDHRFHLRTGLAGATFRGYRYTPDDSGAGCLGTPCGEFNGPDFSPSVADMSWEFWEEM
ncbi:MAG: glycoside hydrolase family 30 beta sandwich domain-containing protein [Akkermansiaceae bacterium]